MSARDGRELTGAVRARVGERESHEGERRTSCGGPALGLIFTRPRLPNDDNQRGFLPSALYDQNMQAALGSPTMTSNVVSAFTLVR